MCKCVFVILTVLTVEIINFSDTVRVQQSCEYSCLSYELSDKNCVNKSEINANATIHETIGNVDFQFDFECDIQTYEILLFYNKNTCNNVTQQHSTYSFKKISYSNETNIKQFDECTEKGNVLLQNIQTGCYKIQILNELNSYILYENTSFWETSYIRHEVNPLKTETKNDSRNNGTELIFIISNPILYYFPEFSLRFECKNCPKHMNSQHSYNLLQDETDPTKLILNSKDSNVQLNISCVLEQNSKSEDGTASCVISPVTIGNYNIVIIYAGDPYKCAHYYPENYKVRIENIVVKADESLQELLPSNYFQTAIGPFLGVICILLSLFVIIVIIKVTKVNIRKVDENISKIQVYSDDLCETPNVLLLYPRNSEDVMTTLTSFRNIFMYQGIQVYDIYDPERLREIHENYHNWILNLTTRNHIKIIIFLTPNGRNLSDFPELQSSIDSIYPFAIKQLLNQISNDCEFSKKIFVAHFSSDTCQYPEYDSFSPNVRFRVPDDLMTLLQHIQNITKIVLNNKSNNEYNTLKENYKKYICGQENINNHI